MAFLASCGSDEDSIQPTSAKLQRTIKQVSTDIDIPSKKEVVSCVPLFWLSELAYEADDPNIGGSCGSMDQTGLVTFTADFMALEPYFGPDGLSCLPLTKGTKSIDGEHLGWFYITKNGYGRGHKEVRDNGCDIRNFVSGVAKTYVNGRLAYMNNKMEIVHQTEFEFGENFWGNGLAIICSKRPKKRLGPHKEHFAYLGGKCGQINSDFEVVTPIEQSYEDFRPLPKWAIPFYSVNTNYQSLPGQGEQLKAVLMEKFLNSPELKDYRVTFNLHDPDRVHIVERWESKLAYEENQRSAYAMEMIEKSQAFIKEINQPTFYEYDPDNGIY